MAYKDICNYVCRILTWNFKDNKRIRQKWVNPCCRSFCLGPDNKYFRFSKSYGLHTTQLCHCSIKAAIADM